jgi:hypothetical protein
MRKGYPAYIIRKEGSMAWSRDNEEEDVSSGCVTLRKQDTGN